MSAILPRPSTTFAGAKILVAEDDDAILYLVAETLRDVGYDVLPVEDGRAALAILDSWQPDGIMLDMQLPRLDGWEVVAQIRGACRRSGLPMIPICIMTAGWRAEEAAQELNVPVWLSKPFKLVELYKAVEDMLTIPAAI